MVIESSVLPQNNKNVCNPWSRMDDTRKELSGSTAPYDNIKIKLHLEVVEPDIEFSESLLNLLSFVPERSMSTRGVASSFESSSESRINCVTGKINER